MDYTRNSGRVHVFGIRCATSASQSGYPIPCSVTPDRFSRREG